MAQKDMARARVILRKVLETDPLNVQAWLAMAEAVEKREHAVDCLRRVLALDPGNALARARLAELKEHGVPSAEGALRAVPPARTGEMPDPGKVKRALPDAGKVKPAQPDAGKMEPPVPTPQPKLTPPGSLERVVTPQAKARQRGPSVPGAKTSGTGERKPATTGNKLERILIVLAGLTGLILVCLTLYVLGQRSLAGLAQATPTKEDVRAVLIENVRAANAEDLGRYMATIHPDSPSYAYTETTLASAFEMFDLGYELTRADVLEQGDTRASISFVLTTRKISGPAFRDNRVSGTMFLRKVDGVWKIYDQKIDDVEYLD